MQLQARSMLPLRPSPHTHLDCMPKPTCTFTPTHTHLHVHTQGSQAPQHLLARHLAQRRGVSRMPRALNIAQRQHSIMGPLVHVCHGRHNNALAHPWSVWLLSVKMRMIK